MDEIIYIVEDDEGIRELYEGAFEGIFATKMFENGKDFFREFTKTRPSLIILDIMLPDMDGYTILTKIREMDEKIPVIIVSAKSDEISAVKGLNKGADDYMTKPFSVLELIARVKTNIRRANLYVTSQKGFVIDNNVYKIFYEGQDLGADLERIQASQNADRTCRRNHRARGAVPRGLGRELYGRNKNARYTYLSAPRQDHRMWRGRCDRYRARYRISLCRTIAYEKEDIL